MVIKDLRESWMLMFEHIDDIVEKIVKEYPEFEKNLDRKIIHNAVTDTMKKAAKVVSSIMSKEMDILSLADDAVSKAGELNQYIAKFKEYEQAAKELGADKVAKEASEAITHYTDKIKKGKGKFKCVNFQTYLRPHKQSYLHLVDLIHQQLVMKNLSTKLHLWLVMFHIAYIPHLPQIQRKTHYLMHSKLHT